MPISKERSGLYPDNWPEIAEQVKRAAGWRCAACGIEGHGSELGVHHFDDDPTNNQRSADGVFWNLHPLCQTCHLTIEAAKWDPFADQTRDLFPLDELKTLDPLTYWFRTALDLYRKHAPDGGRQRPRPRTARRPPTAKRTEASGQRELFHDDETAEAGGSDPPDVPSDPGSVHSSPAA